MFLRRFLYLLTLVGLLVFYGAHQQWVAWILLLTGLLFPLFSLVFSLPAMLSFRLAPELPRTLRMGSAEAVGLRGRCKFPHPPVRSTLLLTRPLTGESWILRHGDDLPTDHCGALTATVHRGKVFDYLGLFSKKIRHPESATGYVWPDPVPMKLPADLDRFLSFRWRPKFGGGFSENHELRLYRPGDSLNQVHWKLTAKTGKLILREPMEPERGLILLTLDVRGTPEELDRKFGRLLTLSRQLLERAVSFEIRAATGQGLLCCPVGSEAALDDALKQLLRATPSGDQRIADLEFSAAWRCHIGGDADEA